MDLSKHWNSDRFYIPAITMMILKLGGYLDLPWKPIIISALVAFFGDLICGAIEGVREIRRENRREAEQ